MTKPEEEFTAADANPRDDDFIDHLLQHDPEFRRTLEKRLEERTVSITEARNRLRWW